MSFQPILLGWIKLPISGKAMESPPPGMVCMPNATTSPITDICLRSTTYFGRILEKDEISVMMDGVSCDLWMNRTLTAMAKHEIHPSRRFTPFPVPSHETIFLLPLPSPEKIMSERFDKPSFICRRFISSRNSGTHLDFRDTICYCRHFAAKDTTETFDLLRLSYNSLHAPIRVRRYYLR